MADLLNGGAVGGASELIEVLSADCPWVEVPPPEAVSWSELQIRRYFDSDGTDRPAEAPPAPIDRAIAEAAAECGASSLHQCATLLCTCDDPARLSALVRYVGLLLAEAPEGPRLHSLLRDLYAAVGEDSPQSPRAFAHLIRFGVSMSGALVQSHPSATGVGVALVLGWGGSGADQLSRHGALYTKLGLHTYCCTAPVMEMEELRAALLFNIAEALRARVDCLQRGGLVVHVCSNVGFYFLPTLCAAWAGLESRPADPAFSGLPSLHSVLKAVVHECCPAILDAYDATAFVYGVLGSVQSQLGLPRMPAELVNRAVHTGQDGARDLLELHQARGVELEKQLDLAVPRHFVYSDADKVLPCEAIARYCQSMRDRHGTELVSEVRAKRSPHMMILALEPELFGPPIHQFLAKHTPIPAGMSAEE